MRSTPDIDTALRGITASIGAAPTTGASSGSLMMLFVALLGLSVLIGALRRRPFWLASSLLGDMGRRASRLWIAAMAILLFLFVQAQFPEMGRTGLTLARHLILGESLPWHAISAMAGSECDGSVASTVVLSQKDPSNYRDPAFPDIAETMEDGRTVTVGNLACLATIHVMLERNRGAIDVFVDDFYQDPRPAGGRSRGAVNPPSYIQAEEPFHAEAALSELRAGHPVILHIAGGAMGHHFVLATDLGDGGTALAVSILDPLPAPGSLRPGRVHHLDASESTWLYPGLEVMPVASMRRVARRWADN